MLQRGDSALFVATYYRRTAVVKLLLDAGADTEVRNIVGIEPTHEWRASVNLSHTIVYIPYR